MQFASIGKSTDNRRWWALAVVIAAQFMVILDVAIVNVALPAIKTDLHFSQASLQWVITSYAILFGGVLMLGGRLADVLGRRRLFVAGVVVFAVGSLLSGLAWSEGSLIAFRALQGLGGALLTPAALSILMTIFQEGRERNVALGIWGAASGSGGAAGVLLGGVLTSYLDWSWIFFINLPVAAVVVAATPWLLQESRLEAARRHFDVAGSVSVTGGIMLLVYAMTRATQDGWMSTSTVALLAAAVALLVAFVAIEARSTWPLLPLGIFRLRTLAAANATAVVIASVGFAEFFLLTLYLQDVLGYSAIQTGLAFIAITLTIIVMSNVAQGLVTRLGVRSVLTAGLTISAAAVGLLTQLPADGHYFWNVFPALIVGGVGLALSFVPVTIAGLAGIERSEAGVASGLINTSRQIGGAVGLAAVSTIAATSTTHYADSHRGVADVGASALTHGYVTAFYVLTALALVGAVIAGVFVEGRPRPAGLEQAPEHAVPSLEEAA
jgi:EmrB/QacA subfamily drug resistance transporter